MGASKIGERLGNRPSIEKKQRYRQWKRVGQLARREETPIIWGGC